MVQLHFRSSSKKQPIRSLRWLVLLLLSVFFAWAMNLAHIPAGWMVGPMIAGIVYAIINVKLTINKWVYHGSQAVIGCLIANSLSFDIMQEALKEWPLFVVVIAVVMLLSWGLGLFLARLGVIPPDVAIWGSSPGAANAMVIMAKEFGSDERLVACMQYIRVLLVVIVASIVASIFTGSGSLITPLFAGWGTVPDFAALAETLALIVASIAIGRVFKIPAGSMLVPMILGAFLHLMGWVKIELPAPLLVLSYALIGWQIGLGFDREILRSSLKAFPRIILSNLILIALCSILGWMVSHWFGIDLLSAYLATSPGGANTVAVIALSTPVNVAFIMALQTFRLIIIILIGPWVSRTLMKLKSRSE